MIAYFVGINIWKKGLFWKSQYWMYYFFTTVITFFYLLLEESRLFWLSSRFIAIFTLVRYKNSSQSLAI